MSNRLVDALAWSMLVETDPQTVLGRNGKPVTEEEMTEVMEWAKNAARVCEFRNGGKGISMQDVGFLVVMGMCAGAKIARDDVDDYIDSLQRGFEIIERKAQEADDARSESEE